MSCSPVNPSPLPRSPRQVLGLIKPVVPPEAPVTMPRRLFNTTRRGPSGDGAVTPVATSSNARSHIPSRVNMIRQYSWRHPKWTSIDIKKAVYLKYGKEMSLRRKARCNEIISKNTTLIMPTFEQVIEYCDGEKWDDAWTLMPVMKRCWKVAFLLGRGGVIPMPTREEEVLPHGVPQVRFPYCYEAAKTVTSTREEEVFPHGVPI
jgi:hypothetical protein